MKTPARLSSVIVILRLSRTAVCTSSLIRRLAERSSLSTHVRSPLIRLNHSLTYVRPIASFPESHES
jgi:hypothetical protein